MASKKRFLVINGPNLNMLGEREPAIYGSDTLQDIQKYTHDQLSNYEFDCEWFQSNIEGEIVDRIQKAYREKINALVINPAAYSHTSVAILDALKMLEIPIIEVHLSNTHRREEFRSTKLTAKASTIIMEGLGKKSYYFGLLSQILGGEKND
jgi:3-dehydroquinate dehydratase II